MVCTHTKPHLKTLISGSMDQEGIRCGNTFTLCHALLKKAILHYTRATEGLDILEAQSPEIQAKIQLHQCTFEHVFEYMGSFLTLNSMAGR